MTILLPTNCEVKSVTGSKVGADGRFSERVHNFCFEPSAVELLELINAGGRREVVLTLILRGIATPWSKESGLHDAPIKSTFWLEIPI
jgi:hypothetical protein